MFKRVLIANRGEIACRIIHTAQAMGIQCVAVYSEADRHSRHAQLADQAIWIGPAPSRDSYLNQQAILNAAQQTNAEAIHPGYGFLAENAEFAAACEQAGIRFIGPPANAIRLMGSKQQAKQLMEKAGVPVMPGYHQADQQQATLLNAAKQIGFPVLLKAAAGGGGKGMRVVSAEKEFASAYQSAKREAKASFSDDTLIVEKYLAEARHVEIQVFCDSQGSGVYLFERDCSIQRRHQKIIEEAPAPGLGPSLRQQMGQAALAAAQAINYVGAGTVEFLLAADGQFYFMEMNTRLQVEHPVTEMITSTDLVAWQLAVACGEPLPVAQSELAIDGHAIEVRLYAEDPQNNFLPATGPILHLEWPEPQPYLRVEHGLTQGDRIGVHYDPMLAKLVTWGETRLQAIQRMEQALDHTTLLGLTHNRAFLLAVLNSQWFVEGLYHTHLLNQQLPSLLQASADPLQQALVLVTLFQLIPEASQQTSPTCNPWANQAPWRCNYQAESTFHWLVDQQPMAVHVKWLSDRQWELTIGADKYHCQGKRQQHQLIAQLNSKMVSATITSTDSQYWLHIEQQDWCIEQPPSLLNNPSAASPHDQALVAPMPGSVVSVLVTTGQQVEQGQPLMVLEAMKMEHTIHAPSAGSVDAIYFKAGDLVSEGTDLLALHVEEANQKEPANA
ncbi:acetyl/propionyl/methylcrotonyl-CoA carboxylase subunit alpha [Spartinivicinus poritis]|uniref:ATP-grasp domain-containing protein n=1 Tax=Spartinivicinus poritis TaxID=2994640 RepID=A0ABT5U8D8_9GAMM|nr:biotin carboxylase N-terminal domain-containing protein [Spartinivicinus sp. A2-2]MDE1462638.1 ATP-grasp domain-containing protein [Spartinivicinus sp. A2-2]